MKSPRSGVQKDGRGFRLLQRNPGHRQPTHANTHVLLRHGRQTACAGILSGRHQQVGGVIHDSAGGVRMLWPIGIGNFNPLMSRNNPLWRPMLIGHAANGPLRLCALGIQDTKAAGRIVGGLPKNLHSPSAAQHCGWHHVLILHPNQRLVTIEIEGRLGQRWRSKHSRRPITALDALGRPFRNFAPTVVQQARSALNNEVVQLGKRRVVGRHPVQVDDASRRFAPPPRNAGQQSGFR